MSGNATYFLAIPVPADVGNLLNAYRRDIPGVQWNTLHELHVTVTYLRQASPRQRQQILESWEHQKPPEPFPVVVEGIGAFLNTPESVLVAGVYATGPLRQLFRRLQASATACGLPAHSYPTFTPHITLASMPRGQVGSVFSLSQPLRHIQPSFLAERVCLYESRRSSGAAQITPLATLEMAR